MISEELYNYLKTKAFAVTEDQMEYVHSLIDLQHHEESSMPLTEGTLHFAPGPDQTVSYNDEEIGAYSPSSSPGSLTVRVIVEGHTRPRNLVWAYHTAK